MSLSLSPQVKEVIQAEGISTQELEAMIAQSAITRVHGASRRYHHWLFVIKKEQDTQVVDRMFKCLPGDERVHKWKNHDPCYGWGCRDCGWGGEVPCN